MHLTHEVVARGVLDFDLATGAVAAAGTPTSTDKSLF
jgi:hypothetical protein